MRLRLSLTTRLLATIVPVVALCMLATGLLALRGAEAVIDRFATKYGSDLATGEVSRIRTYFEQQVGGARSLAEAASSMAANGRDDRALLADLVRRLAVASTGSIGTWLFMEPDVIGRDADFRNASIAEGDPDTGRFLVYYAVREGLEGYEPAPPGFEREIYYAEPKRRLAAFMTPGYVYTIFGRPVLIASFVLPVMVGDRFVGVAGVDFDSLTISQFLSTLRPLGGSVRIVNGDGTWGYTPDMALIGTMGESLADPLSRLTSEEWAAARVGEGYQRDVTVSVDGRTATFRRVAVPLSLFDGDARGRLLLVDLPLSELRRPFLDIGRAIILAGVASVLLVAVALVFGVRQFVARPLGRMTQSVAALRQGDYGREVPSQSRPDVIGDIARALEAFRQSLIERTSLVASLDQRSTENVRLVAAIEEAQDAIVIFDPEFKVTYANRAALQLIGARDAAQVLGRRWRTLLTPETALRIDTMRPPMPEVLAGSGRWTGEVEDWRTVLGGHVERIEGRATRLSDCYILMAFRDVTQERRNEQERMEMEQRLVQQQKLEAVGRLAGGIAHDFNNLLGAIMGYLEFLVADLPEGSPQRAYAERAARVGERSKDMIRHILSFSRPGASSIAAVAPAAILAETEALLRPTMPSSLRLEVEAEPGLPPAAANATQIVQVLMNLAINARDACADSVGAIRIAAMRGASSAVGLPEGWPRYRALIPAGDGPFVVLEVRDEGHGIPADRLPTIFEPFFSTKEAKGTGLGLATVYAIVKAHGGGLCVASKPGEGTIVHVTLPVSHAARELAPADARPTGGAHGTGVRVLVVDDETEMGDMLMEGLGRRGFEVAVCENAEEALEVFQEDPASFDAVVSDQTMPGASGMALIAMLKAIRGDLVCVLYTGYSERLDEAGALRGGADAYFTKPVRVRDLAATLARLTARARAG